MTYHDEMKLHTLLSEMHTDAQTLNLETPYPVRTERSFCSDAPTEVDTRPGTCTPPAVRRGVKRERPLHSGQDATSMSNDDADPSKHREHHNQHTRKCRARLKKKIDDVLNMLPSPPPSQEVKHKVQILEYTMQTFQSLGVELSELEMRLALQSRRNLLRWVDTFAGKEQDISAALLPFIDMFCSERSWVYAEVWRPAIANPQTAVVEPDVFRDMFVERFVVKEATWCSKQTTEKLRQLGERFERTQEVVPGKDPQLKMVVQTLQPQVSNRRSHTQRARLLAEAGVGTCMLVPVVVDAEVVRIVAFCDIRERQVEKDTKNLAVFIATSIGNAHNAALQERNIKRNHGGAAGRGRSSNRSRR